MYEKKDMTTVDIQSLKKRSVLVKKDIKSGLVAYFIFVGFLGGLSFVPLILDYSWWALPVLFFIFAVLLWCRLHADIRKLNHDIKEKKKEIIEGIVNSKHALNNFYTIEIDGDNIEVSFQFCTECKVGDTVVIERACKSKINITESCIA